jgi:hypothetical protein
MPPRSPAVFTSEIGGLGQPAYLLQDTVTV